MTRVVIALDVGGTKAHGAVFDAELCVLFEETAPTTGRDPGLRSTHSLVSRLHGKARALDLTVAAVGGGFPEYVSPAGELTSAEVLEWQDQPAVVLAEALPRVPVVVESDVRCGALGELRHGHGLDDFLYVSLGTGLSSVLISEGRIRLGRRGEAIGLGEFAVASDIDRSWSGNLEAYSSGTGVAARYAHATGSTGIDGARDVVARASAGDATASSVLETAGRALGAALAQTVAVLDPYAVVLGGGFGVAETVLTAATRDELERRTRRRPGPPPLLVSTLGARAGLIGAACHAWRAAGSDGGAP